MKKLHGLFIGAIGIAVFVCYYLGASMYGASSKYKGASHFLEAAWPMPAIALALVASGVYVYIRGK